MPRAKGQQKAKRLARMHWRSGRRNEDSEPRSRQRWNKKKELWEKLS